MIDEKAVDYLINTFQSFLNGQIPVTFDSSVRDSIENSDLKELFDLMEKAISGEKDGSQLKNDLLVKNDLEQILAENQKNLNAIAECSGDSIWITDIATQNLIFASQSIFNFFGFTAEKAINKPFIESFRSVINDTEKKYLKNMYNKIVSGEPLSNESIQYSITKDDGQIIYLETNNTIINDQYGKPKEILGITRDISKRIATEKALKESEEKYRLITETALDAIWKIDAKSLMYNYMSPTVRKMAGYSPEDILKIPLSEALVPESFEKAKQLLNKRNELPIDQEFDICERFQIFKKSGEIVDIEATASFIRDNNGEIIEIVGVSRDITERIKIENALLKSEARLTELLAIQSIRNKQLINQLHYLYNNIISAIAFFDIDGDTIKFSSCNNKWAERIGYTPKELEGFDISKLTDHDTSDLYRKLIQKAINERSSIQEYVRWHNLDLYAIVIPLIRENSDVITSCGSLVYDISAKIESDKKIREAEDRFLSIFNNSKDAIVLMTKELEIVEVNEGFYNLHGSRDYYKENIIESYFPKKHQKLVMDMITSLKDESSIPSFECEVFKHDKTIVPVEISTSLITLNQMQLLLCIIRDISIKKEMERNITNVGTLIETRERRKLAADLHDNVGPLLSSMNMYLSVLSRKEDLQPYQEMLSDIRRILKDAISSVREISNNLSPHVLQNFGLTAALEMFFETKKRLINVLIINNIGDLRFSEIQETMAFRIIIEAFNNTLKHSNADLVKLEILKENNNILILYKDNGIGFDLKDKTKPQSSNLGLFSIINRIKVLEATYNIETSPGNGFELRFDFSINN